MIWMLNVEFWWIENLKSELQIPISGKGLSIKDVTINLTFSDPPPPGHIATIMWPHPPAYKSDVTNIYPIYPA